MRILLTVHQFLPRYYSGTEVLARDTGLELLRRGHEVHVLTTDPRARGRSSKLRHEDYDYRGLKVRALALPEPRGPVERVRYEYDNPHVARHARRYVEEIAPDVAHVFHAVQLSGSIFGVLEEAGLPVVYTPTDFWGICLRGSLMKPSGEISEGPDDISSNCLECRHAERWLPAWEVARGSLLGGKEGLYRKTAERALAGPPDGRLLGGDRRRMAIVRAVLARTAYLRERVNAMDAILAPTRLMAEKLIENGINPALVRHSPYGMDLSGLRRGAAVASRRAEGDGALRLGYVGTISAQKGLSVLLTAFRRLPKDGRVTLRICGDLGKNPDYARAVHARAGGDPRVNFAGTFPNEKIGEEMGKIDALVVPSTWHENAPLVVYSALAAGVPVVASNVGGMAGIVRHGENGLLFEPGDPGDLALQLRRLLFEPGLLAGLAEGAGEVRTVQDSVDEMLELYERLLLEKAKPEGAGRDRGTLVGARGEEADAS